MDKHESRVEITYDEALELRKFGIYVISSDELELELEAQLEAE